MMFLMMFAATAALISAHISLARGSDAAPDVCYFCRLDSFDVPDSALIAWIDWWKRASEPGLDDESRTYYLKPLRLARPVQKQRIIV